MICNICGSENLIKGTIYDTAGGGSTGFIPEETSAFKKMFAMGGREIQSYGCIHCGNLQFLIDFSEEDKQQHLDFQRQPPSVTENSDDEK
jgi:hypothetical protein